MKRFLYLSTVLGFIVAACQKPIHVNPPNNCVVCYIPNSFTPNNDGKNDVWYPVISPFRDRKNNWQFPRDSTPYDTVCYEHSISHYNLEIYDHNNKILFETTTYYQGWNGIRKGKRCQAGSYKYKLWWYDADGTKTLFEGRIELLL